MKSIVVVIFSVILLPLSAWAGGTPYGCEKKLLHLERQLSYAKHYNNHYRVKGLESAINRVKSQCYDGYSGATGATRLIDNDLEERWKVERNLEGIEKLVEALKELKGFNGNSE